MYHQQMQQLANNSNNNSNNKIKNTNTTTYSIKKVLKTFFKKQQNKQQSHHQQAQPTPTSSIETFEDLDNLRNMQAEQHQFYNEIIENSANEKLSHMVYEYCNEIPEEEHQEDIYVPVRFARTAAGTFFWTTNLQPVTCTLVPAVDEDLLQPAYCYSNNQYPLMQFQDRWAQA